jgi:hypothetical protein
MKWDHELEGRSILPKRGNRFSLSPGERAGVRASVDYLMLLGFTEMQDQPQNTRLSAQQSPHVIIAAQHEVFGFAGED